MARFEKVGLFPVKGKVTPDLIVQRGVAAVKPENLMLKEIPFSLLACS